MRVEKKCTGCNQTLDRSMFHKRTYPTGKIGYQPKCKRCQHNQRTQYYKPHEYARRKFKLSEEDYNTLMEHTNCQVCGVHMDKKCIDHDHKTNTIIQTRTTRQDTNATNIKTSNMNTPNN